MKTDIVPSFAKRYASVSPLAFTPSPTHTNFMSSSNGSAPSPLRWPTHARMRNTGIIASISSESGVISPKNWPSIINASFVVSIADERKKFVPAKIADWRTGKSRVTWARPLTEIDQTITSAGQMGLPRGWTMNGDGLFGGATTAATVVKIRQAISNTVTAQAITIHKAKTYMITTCTTQGR